jgi:mannose-6-phosphate isomerase
MRPYRLGTSAREKVWGSTRLSPWFPDSQAKIGEVWFENTPPLPILVKLIFTEEALSVQVHPGDDYAREHHQSAGKTEMWHILRADPGARIAIGLREPLTKERLREVSLSGEIEHLLNWVAVRPGDTFHIPAGTIHAIGGGLALCEIQQNSDVTYRLYDYGRPRELHLDAGLQVSRREPWKPPTPPPGLLASCDYYATELIDIGTVHEIAPLPDRFQLLIVTSGEGTMAGEAFRAGEAWFLPAGSEPVVVEPQGSARMLRTFVP